MGEGDLSLFKWKGHTFVQLQMITKLIKCIHKIFKSFPPELLGQSYKLYSYLHLFELVSQVSDVAHEPLVCLYVKYIWFIFNEIFLRSRFEQTGNIKRKTLLQTKTDVPTYWSTKEQGVNFLFRRAHGFSEISGVLLGSWRGHGVRWYTVSSEISGVSLGSFIHQNQFHSD